MASFPSDIEAVITSVGIKIGLALFYKHKGRPAAADYWTAGYWTQTADQRTLSEWIKTVDALTQVEIGKRSNTNLRNRFRYRWGTEEQGHTDIFACLVQFGEGLVLYLIVAKDKFWDDEVDGPNCIKVEDWCRKRLSRPLLD